MTYKEILSSLRTLRLQGAEKIALAGVEAFSIKLKETSHYQRLKKYYHEIKAARLTESALRNAVKYCLEHYQTDPNVRQTVASYFKKSQERIAEIGAKKIKTGMIIATHCYSETVIAVILKAWQQGKNVTVAITETRPNLTGRLTAKTLAKHGITVHYFIDAAGRMAIKPADLFLFGCDAISKKGHIINKIGTALLLEFAHKYNVPAYGCTNTWKYDPDTNYGPDEEIEPRDPHEIWKNPPKNIIIHNPGFETVSYHLITTLITELGIIKRGALINEVHKQYPWLI